HRRRRLEWLLGADFAVERSTDPVARRSDALHRSANATRPAKRARGRAQQSTALPDGAGAGDLRGRGGRRRGESRAGRSGGVSQESRPISSGGGETPARNTPGGTAGYWQDPPGAGRGWRSRRSV